MPSLFEPMSFSRGPAMKNRFMLAPLTNTQSHKDGTLSDVELNWIEMRAKGGFGSTMSAAAHVQANGQGFPGQLGIFSDDHIEGLARMAALIKKHDSVAIVQLHHAGNRSPADVIGGTPVCPSDDPESGARALSTVEVAELIEAFIAAAKRAETAGFDGVEVHGAHGYIISQFLSPEINKRTDQYGGSLENRSRIIFDVVNGIRARCRPDFNVSIRLSPERFGLRLAEVIKVAQRLLNEGAIDFLDMSLWDCFKEPVEEEFKGRSLLSYFAELDRGNVKLGVAGKINSTKAAEACLDQGVDFVLLGRAAILHHDFPLQAEQDADFVAASLPVSADYLRGEGLGENFLVYMSGWKGFVAA
ncbi:MAG: NADH:flavin oxidoreductase [Rhodospirillaceae bacterium]|nr:NADH:flavin oxidoreductase [Rhodospirillaceae bacterium]MBT3493784.1 NADH:flavin oxidoreductase [Rhodospirillaceae bacterium]MBT3779409.1 NADH:flavin oxidoreductase [Rhodospirillaceae bacterium]MBT3977995.1 NADH:flavin oxidoreductase [Rhodospirillaceae bacterium]MBT4171149.1 NADH:flavin oxidoreductase [Rhodospirillaceae bacterium]